MSEDGSNIEKTNSGVRPVKGNYVGMESPNAPHPSDDVRQELVRYAQFWSGPLPPPEQLKAYREVDPSLPDVIVQRWGAEQDHRHRTDRALVDSQIRRAQTGQWLAFLLGIGGLALAGVVATVANAPNHAVAIFGGIVSVMSAVYVYERWASRPPRRQKKEPNDSDNELTG